MTTEGSRSRCRRCSACSSSRWAPRNSCAGAGSSHSGGTARTRAAGDQPSSRSRASSACCSPCAHAWRAARSQARPQPTPRPTQASVSIRRIQEYYSDTCPYLPGKPRVRAKPKPKPKPKPKAKPKPDPKPNPSPSPSLSLSLSLRSLSLTRPQLHAERAAALLVRHLPRLDQPTQGEGEG